jgi:hypothetical protein
MSSLTIQVNGTKLAVDTPFVLRDRLGLHGLRFGGGLAVRQLRGVTMRAVLFVDPDRDLTLASSQTPSRQASSSKSWLFPAGFWRADDGVRTRDPQLGKLMLYQLSYVRVSKRVPHPRSNRG